MDCLANKKSAKKVREDAIDFTSRCMHIIVASIYTDKLGHGKEETLKFLDMIQDRADSVLKGYVSIEDYEKVLKEEYGITISR